MGRLTVNPFAKLYHAFKVTVAGQCDKDDKAIVKFLTLGLRVVQLVAGPRTNAHDDGFAFALTDQGNVYSWGKQTKGRLGHSTSENIRAPRIIDGLAGKNIIQVIVVIDYATAQLLVFIMQWLSIHTCCKFCFVFVTKFFSVSTYSSSSLSVVVEQCTRQSFCCASLDLML